MFLTLPGEPAWKALPRRVRVILDRLRAAGAGSILLAVLAMLSGCGQPATPLRRFQPVADFTLTERSGRAITRSDLLGKILVVDFFFAGCSAECTALAWRMTEIQRLTAGLTNVLLVSLTVDPQSDTPERLVRYANQYFADRDRWLFLTGDQRALHHLIKTSFLLPAAENEQARAALDGRFIHSDKIALVDATGTVRAYYDSKESSSGRKILADIQQLLRER
jgi:protein SCO1